MLYILVHGSDHEELEYKVNQKLLFGFQLHGHPVIEHDSENGNSFLQAMTYSGPKLEHYRECYERRCDELGISQVGVKGIK